MYAKCKNIFMWHSNLLYICMVMFSIMDCTICSVGCCEVLVKRAPVESTKIECNINCNIATLLLKAIVISSRFDSVNVDEGTIVKRRDLGGRASLWHLVSCEGHIYCHIFKL